MKDRESVRTVPVLVGADEKGSELNVILQRESSAKTVQVWTRQETRTCVITTAYTEKEQIILANQGKLHILFKH